MDNTEKWTEDDLLSMFANPKYCLKEIKGWRSQETLVDRKEWVKINVKAVKKKDISLDKLLNMILDNLESSETPFGYQEGGE